jgi:translocator protein
MTSSASSAEPRNPSSHSAAALVGFLVLCYAVAALGALSAAQAIPTWYAALAKPSFNPPNWIFAPVWTILYGLMAAAAWLVWRTPKDGRSAGCRHSGLLYFAGQLILNALWAPVFFYFHRILPALVIILGLWVVLLFTTLRFRRVDRLAGALMFPYLAWVAFASTLNYAIFRLN